MQLGSLAIATATLVAILLPGAIPDPVPDPIKTMSPQRRGQQKVLFSGWSSVFRVDVLQPSENAPFLTLHHDGNIGSALHRFNGDFRSVTRYDDEKRSQPFSVLRPGPKVLIIGLAGGQELLASLYLGASQVTGVELNPLRRFSPTASPTLPGESRPTRAPWWSTPRGAPFSTKPTTSTT